MKLKQVEWQKIREAEVYKGIPYWLSAVPKHKNTWLCDVKKRMVNDETFDSWFLKNQDAF